MKVNLILNQNIRKIWKLFLLVSDKNHFFQLWALGLGWNQNSKGGTYCTQPLWPQFTEFFSAASTYHQYWRHPRALIFLQMFKRRAWERLRSIFPATGAKLPHPTGPQLPRLAVLSSRIYFRLFDKHFQMFNFGSPTPGIFNSLTKVWGRGGWKFQLERDWVWETGHGRFWIGYIALLMPLFSQRTLWTWLRPGFHL